MQNLEQFGRFLAPALFILMSLAEGPKHKYAMIEDIKCLYAVYLGPGTLYSALARLEKQGWIKALSPEDRRRPYRFTESGSRLLQD